MTLRPECDEKEAMRDRDKEGMMMVMRKRRVVMMKMIRGSKTRRRTRSTQERQ